MKANNYSCEGINIMIFYIKVVTLFIETYNFINKDKKEIHTTVHLFANLL